MKKLRNALIALWALAQGCGSPIGVFAAEHFASTSESALSGCLSNSSVRERFKILKSGRVNWDIQRKSPRVLVIHELRNKPGKSKAWLSRVEKERLYSRCGRKHSGHFHEVNGKVKEVYWAYHYWGRTDGKVERLLSWRELGWHAANWEVNRESLAYALDGNWDESSPPEAMLEALNAKIRAIEKEIGHKIPIVPHYAVSLAEDTPCPGPWFWKWLERDWPDHVEMSRTYIVMAKAESWEKVAER